jgi:dTDP-4-dehydrorhamnose 3,5-epimerase-like enzyme
LPTKENVMVDGKLIDDVQVISLTTHKDERGFFREIFRINANNTGSVKQISHSFVKQDVKKGWHAHVYQTQWNYVVSGRLRVVLIDNRSESKTHGNIMSFNAGQDDLIGYVFPPGILHGYLCVKGPVNIIYGTSGYYDLSDEVRIPLTDFKQSYI